MKDNTNILVLSELNSTSNKVLESGITLAKIIGGSVDFFYAKDAAKVVERENQLSAIRTINHDYIATEKTIKSLIDKASKQHGVAITYNLALGNVKHDISDYIDKTKPDIIVLEKRKSSTLNLAGNNITSFLLKQFSGSILFVDTSTAITEKSDLILGVLNISQALLGSNILKCLANQAKPPIKSFSIGKTPQDTSIDAKSNLKTIDYVFEQNDDAINSISGYVTKNNINLLCINDSLTQSKTQNNLTKQIINKFNVSVLVIRNQ